MLALLAAPLLWGCGKPADTATRSPSENPSAPASPGPLAESEARAAKAAQHLQAMENIFRNLQKDDFRRFLRQAQNLEQIRETIMEADEPRS